MKEGLYPEGAEAVRARMDRQRMEALAVGNERRYKAAELKRKIRAGEVDPVVLLEGHLEEWEEHLSHTKVQQFLMAIPRIGVSTTREVLNELNLNPNTRFRDLTMLRREELAAMLRLIKWKIV